MAKKAIFQEQLFKPESDWRPNPDLPRFDGVKMLALDIETKDPDLRTLGPGPRRAGTRIVGLSYATDDGRCGYLPIGHEGGDNLDPDVVRRWMKTELNRYSGEIVGAKIDYDLDFLATQEGVTFPDVEKYHDIQVIEPLLDEWRYEYSLEALARDYVGKGKDEALLREAGLCYGLGAGADAIKENLWRFPARYVGPYAEADADLPMKILPLQLKKLESEDLLGVYEVERKLIPVLLAMRRRGVRVDLDAAERARDKLSSERDRWLAEARRIGGSKVEFKAPASFAPALAKRGLQFPTTAKTGQASITKGWLEANKSDELVRAILEGRRVDTILNTFIDGHVFGHAIGGRIHCSFKQSKSDDGGTIARLSSSDPNLQNLPARDEELGPMIRGIFVPEEGEEWQRLDLSQIEYRYLAHFAVGKGAEEARQKYCDDPTTDFHVMCGEFAGMNGHDKYVRGRVKSLNFCKVYGGGAGKVALMLGVSKDEAKVFIERYDRELPFVSQTFKKAMEWAERRGFVVDVLGRKQRFLLWEPRDNYGHEFPGLRREEALNKYGPNIRLAYLHAALNRKLQASAASHIKKTMVDCWEAGVQNVLGAFLVTVHDEQGSSVPKTQAGDEAAKEVKRLMECAIPLRVPVIAEESRGANWGVCK